MPQDEDHKSTQKSKSEHLIDELTKLRKGLGLGELGRLRNCTTLIELARTIRRRGQDDDVDPIFDAHNLLLEAIQELPETSKPIANSSFGVGASDRDLLLDRRLSNLAMSLDLDIRTVRRREKTVLENIAHWVVAREHEMRLREAAARIERRQPASESLAVDWLDRFHYYYRMWTDLSGIRNDFEVYQNRRRAYPPDQDGLPTYSRSSIFYFTRCIVHLEQFVEEKGGLWLASSADSEVAVADAVYRITVHLPADDIQQSWLRTELRRIPDWEPRGFIQALEGQQMGRAFIERWGKWMRTCGCDLNAPSKSCEVHSVIALCNLYMETIDKEWYRIADWYRLPPKVIGDKSLSEETLLSNFPYVVNDIEIPANDRQEGSQENSSS